ncbi:MAG: hypothetical protein P1U74_04270 [Legionellaceae bacterium]|nr:hypothetical protein [Legionellaceae bacterium]
MTAESYLKEKLQKFSIVDIGLIKGVYLLVGLLLCSLYPKLITIHWFFYLIVSIFCSLPIWVHLFSQKGSLIKKATEYLKTNNPANQTLLFFTMFFFALMLGSLIPAITQFDWWVYLIAIVVLAIKPLQTSWIW